jgi:hypothetical protein
LEGVDGYAHTSALRAKQLCNVTDEQWNAGNFASLKPCLQNMTVKRFIDLEGVSGNKLILLFNVCEAVH